MKKQSGFTLIELMIVVAIIGILAAVAIPQYQDYTAKAKAANLVTSLDGLKSAVAICIQEAGGVPDKCDTGKDPIKAFTATKEIASASVSAGVITATFATGISSTVDGKKVTFEPDLTDPNTIVWKVTSTVTNDAVLQALTKNNKTVAAAS